MRTIADQDAATTSDHREKATMNPPTTTDDFYCYLLLDRTDPEQCLWVPAIPVDKQSFPALLDQHGHPEPGELARAMNTASRLLGSRIHLQAVIGTGGLVHRVMAPDPQSARH